MRPVILLWRPRVEAAALEKVPLLPVIDMYAAAGTLTDQHQFDAS